MRGGPRRRLSPRRRSLPSLPSRSAWSPVLQHCPRRARARSHPQRQPNKETAHDRDRHSSHHRQSPHRLHPGRNRLTPWLQPLSEEDLTGRHWAGLVDASRSKSSYFMLLARDPEILEARTKTDKDIFYNTKAGLPRAERELSAAAASRFNGCIFCASVHSRFASHHSKRAGDVQKPLDEGTDADLGSRRWNAVTKVSVALTETPSTFGITDIERLAVGRSRRSRDCRHDPRCCLLQLGKPADAVAWRANTSNLTSATRTCLTVAGRDCRQRQPPLTTALGGATYPHIFVTPLPTKSAPCDDWRMRFVAIIHRLLLLSGLLGILLSPVNVGMAGSAMAASVSTLMTAMPEEMARCPGETSGCDGVACPMALLCATAFVGHAAGETPVNLVWTAHRFLNVPSPVLASSLVDPPVRPPRV